MKKVSVILPTYNERANILHLIEEIQRNLASFDYEILLVDDNSPDGTYKVVRDAKLEFVKTILRTENRGLANSVYCGIENASSEIIIVMDTDFNHQPKELSFMVHAAEYYDCVCGSRFIYGGSMPSKLRFWLSCWFNYFVRWTMGSNFTDNLSGFFAIRKSVINQVDPKKIFWGYGDYYIRLLYFLQKRKFDILQFPVAYGVRKGGKSKSSFVKIFVQYSTETLRLAIRERFTFSKKEK